MNIRLLNFDGNNIAVVESRGILITDGQSALDFAMTVFCETGATRIVVDKNAVCREFFILSSGLAGDVLQKLVNYGIKLAIYGDYSGYTSKPLKDFFTESNRGDNFFFVATQEEAVQKFKHCDKFLQS